MLKKTNLPLGAKKNIVIVLYHIIVYIIILFCIAFFFFLHPMANLFFLAYLLLSVFYTRLMRPNKVETGRGLLT